MTTPVTESQLSYIMAHIDDRPRTAVARAAGVSVSTLYRIVRQHGGQIRHELSTRREGSLQAVAALYPDMTAREVARATGLSKSTVLHIAAQLSLSHTPDTLRRIAEQRRRILKEGRENRDLQAAGRRRRALFRLEYYRLWEGKPQRTALRLSRFSRRQYHALWYLMKRYGYVRAEGDTSLVLRYSPGTTRTKREHYFTRRHSITFLPLPEGMRASRHPAIMNPQKQKI